MILCYSKRKMHYLDGIEGFGSEEGINTVYEKSNDIGYASGFDTVDISV